MSPSLKSPNLRVVVVGKIAGGVSRLLEDSAGKLRVESWTPKGWAPGGASPDEFMPGSVLPVSETLAKRLGIPSDDLSEAGFSGG